MNSNEQFQTPKGFISMFMHRGGIWNPETNKIEGGEIIDALEVPNLIVNKASVLMAQRLAPGSAQGVNTGTFIADGLQYLAVGTGNWTDLQTPVDPQLSDVKLKAELFRKEFTDWSFLNADGSKAAGATNILQLVTTFENNEAVGALVEMGLFGGNASASKDSGHMFNYKTFKVWNKPDDARLIVSRGA